MEKPIFKKATRRQARLRMAICGPTGSGKTWTGLKVATGLGPRVAGIDTEHGTMSKYASGRPFDFDVVELDDFRPAAYIAAIVEADAQGYDAILIDSLSHAWMGKGGLLEQADRGSVRAGENRFTIWKDLTPQHNALVEAMLGCRAHLIVTMRSKMDYVLELNDKGKQVPRKVGMAPIQRDGVEYEFDVVGDMDQTHTLFVTKSRCEELADAVLVRPGDELVAQLRIWLTDGAPPAPSTAERLVVQADAVTTELELATLKMRTREAWDRLTPAERARVGDAGKAASDRVKGAPLDPSEPAWPDPVKPERADAPLDPSRPVLANDEPDPWGLKPESDGASRSNGQGDESSTETPGASGQAPPASAPEAEHEPKPKARPAKGR